MNPITNVLALMVRIFYTKILTVGGIKLAKGFGIHSLGHKTHNQYSSTHGHTFLYTYIGSWGY